MRPAPPLPRRVLLIDADIHYRRLVRSRITPSHYSIHEAASEREAASMVASIDPQLIILGSTRPTDADGDGLLGRLRRNDATRGLPIVKISDTAGLDALAAAIQDGATEVVLKQDPAGLLSAIERALLPRERERNRYEAADILHLDDDDGWTDLVRIWLERRGLKTQRVRSLADLRTYLIRCRRLPRCLLLDLGLQDGDGLEFLERLKESPKFQNLPVVVFTGRPVTPLECLERFALGRLIKDPGVEEELGRTLEAVLSQQDRTQGVVDAGDLRLDPRTREVFRAGRSPVHLEPGRYAALHLLVCSSPSALEDAALYQAFLERHSYKGSDGELTVRQTVRNYVSRLRHALGPELGARIVYVKGEGYAYRPPVPLPVF